MRRGISLLFGILVVAVAGVCEAQSPPDSNTTGAPPSAVPQLPAGTTAPKAIPGKPCERTFPPVTERVVPSKPTILKFLIEPDGTVKDVVVVQSSGDANADRGVADCAATWTFHPATANGQPIEVSHEIAINWGTR